MVHKIMLTTAQIVFAGIISMVLFPPEKVVPLLTVAASWFLAGYFTRGFWAASPSRT
jgi:hypothetical protein